MEQKFVVRDLRKKEKFQIDDEYLNGYAKLCGTNATLVYLCLCRHADYHTQECFPSVNMMSEKLGISRDSVMTGIKNLLEWNIILKERVRNPNNAKWINNSYTLLDKSVWKEKPSRFEPLGVAKSEIGASQVGNKGKSQVAVVDCKDTHKDKDTHIYKDSTIVEQPEVANINKIFNILYKINPSLNYAIPSYRKSAEWLISKYGFEKSVGLAEYAVSIFGKDYAPSITNPTELKNKLSKLAEFAKKNKKNNYIKL